MWELAPFYDTHEGTFSSLFNLLPFNVVEHFAGVKILLPRMNYAHEIVGTHGAKPLACIGLYTGMNG